MRRCVWSRNLVNEEALAHWWLLREKQTYNNDDNDEDEDHDKQNI